jgi:DNA-directed RNA polymerase subunit F
MKPLRKALSPIPTINDLLGDYPLRYSVFGFPLIQKENSILNSILAHEVGHFVDDAKKTSEKLMSKVKLDPKLVEKIAKTAESAVVGNKKGVKLTYFITPEELKAQITKLAVSQISEWVKELVSDVIAFQLVGPVYLFSLVSLLFTEIDIDEASGDHPPPRIRTTLLLEEFEKQDYCRFIKEIKDEKKREIAGNLISLVQSIKNLLVSVEQIEVEDFTKLVVGSVQQIIPQVREEASKIVSQNRYEPQRFAEEVFKLFDLLDFVIPPVEIETGKPASISSILNAGSLYESLLIENLYKVFEAKTTKEQMMVRNKLHKLILKALELNHIEAQMKKRLKS